MSTRFPHRPDQDERNEDDESEDDESEDDEQIDPALLRPLESAADVGRSNYARVQFDQHISDALEEHARGRAPSDSDQDFRNHLLGVASEVATATWRRGEIDNRILQDYEGDDGIDVMAPNPRGDGTDFFQVKATRDESNPERIVSREELEVADYFVLCTTRAPSRYVEIVGYISKPLLWLIGETYQREGYLLTPENLFPVRPGLYDADDVRDVMYG